MIITIYIDYNADRTGRIMRNFDKFIADCKSINIDLTDKQLLQFDQYYDLLIKWNEVMNLTTITYFEDVCKLHFLDSLVSTLYFNRKNIYH